MTEAIRLSNMEEITALKPEWEDLLRRASNMSIFMTWEWLVTWWEIYGENHDLHWLIVRRRDGKLTGGAPLYIRKLGNGWVLPHRELRFVGTGASVSPEHLDVVADPECTDEVIRALRDYWVDRFSDWDVLLLTDISHPRAAAYRLAEELSGQGVTAVIEQQTPGAPSISFPVSWEEYFQSLGSRMRAHIGRCRRKLAREIGAAFELWSPEDGGLDRAFDEFERLFAARKESIRIGNKFETARGYRAFHHKLAGRFAERGWLYLAFLKAQKRALAAEYCFRYGQTLYSYQFGFEPALAKKNVFKVLRSWVIEDAIRSGLTEFDLLRGEESYKFHWNADIRPKQLVKCFSPTFYGRAIHGMAEWRQRGKRIIQKAGMIQQ